MAETPRGDVRLTFPDQPRLELDQLLTQLVDRAQEVLATQGRLRGLLSATQLINGELELASVLRHVAEAARELIGARYAALGVIEPGDGLAEFVHVGMPEEDVARIGHLPEGKGLLGALVEDPRPIRLRSIGDDERSSGFPAGHPRMDSFLGVPIQLRDEVFGNLYLTESLHGEFTSEDEQLALALAATAGLAIENARLYEAARRRGEWLQATASLTRELLASDVPDADATLRAVAERSREVAGAALAMVLMPSGDDAELEVRTAVGHGADDLSDESVAVRESVAGNVFRTRLPVRLASPEEAGGRLALDLPRLGPVLLVPLAGSGRVHGVLGLVRAAGAPTFSEEDLQMASGFANQAAVAVELSQARAEQQRAAMLEERDRIAADLHDHVIQRLFAAGLSLQGIAVGLPPGRVADRITGTVGDLDDTISQIRNTIFQLQRLPEARDPGVRGRVLDVLAEVAPALGFQPTLRLAGPMEHLLPAELVEDLLAVLREALTNVARHAAAASATVDLTSTPESLTLVVQDDGRGFVPGGRRSGLANMRRRAERHGGTFELVPRLPAGTELTWSVPLHGAAGRAEE